MDFFSKICPSLNFMQDKPKTSDRAYYLFALKIIGDFGASIAVPIVIFVLVGQWLDQKYQKGPWFTALAFVLAALISGKIIYRRAKIYGAEYQALDNKNTKQK